MPRANGITRQEILTTIKCNGSMTAEELARALGISQVAVRQHLSGLEAEGIVVVDVERRGLGRPAHRYSLTRRGDEIFPRQYDDLANAILDELRSWQGDEALSALFERRRERMNALLASQLDRISPNDRAAEIARILSQNGFMAEVISDADGVIRLVKRNCAISAVARRHPELCCEKEAEFYARLIGDATVERETSILTGDHVCAFRIRLGVAAAQAEAQAAAVATPEAPVP